MESAQEQYHSRNEPLGSEALSRCSLPKGPPIDSQNIADEITASWNEMKLPARPKLYATDFVNSPAAVTEGASALTGAKPVDLATKQLLQSDGSVMGPLFLQTRIGKNGNEFTVIKLKTMRQVSEVKPEELTKDVTLGKFGKIENHPRVTSLGRILRKYWLDEIPQLVNVMKGDMQVVGWRPLTKSDLQSFPADFQDHYKSEKPGLISPLYAKEPVGRDAVLSEARAYYSSLLQNRFATKVSYLCQAIWGIVVHGRRGF
jgi:hypothetical protein